MSTEIVEQLTQQLKALETADLFKVLKAGLAEAEKKAKTKAVAKKKAGSMPRGDIPPQLKLNNAWVKHVKDYVNQHGWEAFVVPTTVTDKATGAKTIVEEMLPASILHNGAYIFEGSVTEKTPEGVQVSHKQAMTLSKQWKEGDKAHLYTEFVEAFDPEDEESDTMSVESGGSEEKVTVVRMTMAEKIAAKAAKDAEKAEAKAAKEAEKANAKAEKARAAAEAAEARAKAKEEKDKAAAELKTKKTLEAAEAKAEKARAAAEATEAKAAKVPKAAIKKAAVVKSVVAMEVVKAEPAAPAAPAVPVASPPIKPKIVKAATVVKAAAPVVKPVVDTWSCEDDGNTHTWIHKGVAYARNYQNDVWCVDADGDITEWKGAYLPAEDRIDETAEEPVYLDDE